MANESLVGSIVGYITLVTPCLDVTPESGWQGHIQATWEYLLNHYKIEFPGSCRIQVQYVPAYNLADVQRIASSIIHFEPAVDAMLSHYRKSDNLFVCGSHGSNWLRSPCLGRVGKSRSQSIAAIQQADRVDQVVRLMYGDHSAGDLEGMVRQFDWNLRRTLRSKQAVQFTKAPGCVNSPEMLAWAHFTMTFIQAAMRHGTPGELEACGPHISGLRSFLGTGHVTGVTDPRMCGKVLAGGPAKAALETDLVFFPCDCQRPCAIL